MFMKFLFSGLWDIIIAIVTEKVNEMKTIVSTANGQKSNDFSTFQIVGFKNWHIPKKYYRISTLSGLNLFGLCLNNMYVCVMDGFVV